MIPNNFYQRVAFIWTFNDPITGDPYEKNMTFEFPEKDKDYITAVERYRNNLWITKVEKDENGKVLTSKPYIKLLDLFNRSAQSRGNGDMFFNDADLTTTGREYLNIPDEYPDHLTRVHIYTTNLS